ncbi:MAG TPA: ABC transporter permease [Blastocatellia bacterium]|nr:ABC transporter permease [Blastocatellia bacterium]
MQTSTLLFRNIAYYWRTNLAVVLGVATAVAVLSGALLVGDSVRASLRDLFLLRLGNTSDVISSTGFFREKLAGDLQSHERFNEAFNGACPLIALDGLVTDERSGRRASGVKVYGVDDRFWKFHGRENKTPGDREIRLSADLARELGSEAGGSILLRIEKPSAIPAGSLHGRKDDLGRTIRLSAIETLSANELGEFSVRPQQGAVRAVFVSLSRLQRDIEQTGRVNTILLSEKSEQSTKLDFAGAILKDIFSLEDLGVKLRVLEEHDSIALESESSIINDELFESAQSAATSTGMKVVPILSYLANSISSGNREVPYSLVTALNRDSFDGLKKLGGQVNETASQLPPIILNEWAANDLGVKLGDTVTLEYYLWKEEGQLSAHTAQFRLSGIVPIKGEAADRDLVPDYPGITETENLSDWDPPFPIDLKRVRPRDEDYWHKYRTTPKAFIPIDEGAKLWQSRYGKFTSLRLLAPDSQSSLETYRQKLRATINPLLTGFLVFPARVEGLQASQGATDFGEYFVYFSFFLVISALLLTSLFFKLGIEQRLREIGTLQALGFPAALIRSLFLREGLMLASIGSVLGVIAALGYGALMMYGLRTWWVGAVGTTMLSLHVSPVSLAVGGAGGIIAALGCIYWTLRMLRRTSARSLLAGTGSVKESDSGTEKKSPRLRLSALSTAVALALFGMLLLLSAILGWIGQTAGFFGAGTMLLVAFLCFEYAWLKARMKKLIHGNGWWPVSHIGFRNATYRPGRSILCIALIASASFIIVAVDAFRRDNRDVTFDRKSGGGGFPLLAESLLPLYHDPNTEEGREALTLTSQKGFDPESVSFTRFRVRPGDDTSCLNLYQPRNPRILAATDDFIRSGRFAFQDSLADTNEEKENPWVLLNDESTDGTIPIIADANSMTYVLHLKLGDEFSLARSDGNPVRLRLVGALADSLFQSELLMSEKNFLRLFPDQGGYSFFLLDVAPEESATAAAVLETQLSDFGFDVTSTAERLASFHRVENTYLSTFQALGGLGLMLGTVGLAIVLLRNVLERRREMALLRAIGYNSKHFTLMVVTENAFLVCCGLVTGTLAAILAIAPAFFSGRGHVSTLSLGVLLSTVLVIGLMASIVATIAALRSPLLPALRSE